MNKEDLYHAIYGAVNNAIKDNEIFLECVIEKAIREERKNFRKIIWLILLIIVGIPIALLILYMFK